VIAGRKIVVVDDSIVRGNTQQAVAAGQVALLLRHRLRDARRAARRPLLGRRDPGVHRRRLARLRVTRRTGRGDGAATRIGMPCMLQRPVPRSGSRERTRQERPGSSDELRAARQCQHRPYARVSAARAIRPLLLAAG
jgi:hypothetical protein